MPGSLSRLAWRIAAASRIKLGVLTRPGSRATTRGICNSPLACSASSNCSSAHGSRSMPSGSSGESDRRTALQPRKRAATGSVRVNFWYRDLLAVGQEPCGVQRGQRRATHLVEVALFEVLGVMAGREMATGVFRQWRLHLRAHIRGVGAARVEAAPRRGIHRVRWLTADQAPSLGGGAMQPRAARDWARFLLFMRAAKVEQTLAELYWRLSSKVPAQEAPAAHIRG